MAEQQRAQKQSQRGEEAPPQVGAGQDAAASERLSAGVQATSGAIAAIDDILADIVPPEGQTELIGGASKPRPTLRQSSSEEFIRAFRQQTGQ